MIQKSYDETPTVYLIPTPIGNLEDITLRTLNIIKSVDILFCEDTRTTGILLKHYNITKRCVSSHKYNEGNNIQKFIELLKEGKSIGIVSDRGTPTISDPGNVLVKEAIKNHFNVVSLPGATAFVPALTVSGFEIDHFLFYGFLSSKKLQRKRELEGIKFEENPIIFYEAPHRIKETLEDIEKILGNRKVCISREISKVHEEIIRDSVKNILSQEINIKGEIVLVVDGNKENHNFEGLTIEEHIEFYVRQNIDVKSAIKLVAKDRKQSKSEIYKIYHKKD